MPSSAKEACEDKKPEFADRWLSATLEELIHELRFREQAGEEGPPDFDIVIVGSGYGGSIAAAHLAGHIDQATGERARICVLERGKEYVAGQFPVSEAQLPAHVRISAANDPAPKGLPDGLFDLRLGQDVSTLVANGLGGGSLINAGVMAEPAAEVLQSSAWPRNLRKPGTLAAYYQGVSKFIAPTPQGSFAKFDPNSAPLKFTALKELTANSTARFSAAPLSISLEGGPNAAGIDLKRCVRCGDCATGCNHQAKNSLDHSALAIAARNGARIVTGATVTRLSRSRPSGWCLHIEHTNLALQRRCGPFLLRARRVILAAGVFGSTEILMRSQGDGLKFASDNLGKRFSTNGDLLAAAYACNRSVNAVATETTPFAERNIGPTITGIVDARDGERGFVIEEFAIPGALRRLFTESFTTAHLFTRLAKADPEGPHASGKPTVDPCAVNVRDIRRTQVFGIMGHDGAKGELELVGDARESGSGAIRVKWPECHKEELNAVFDKQVVTLEKLARNSGTGGTVLGNPVWRLLPQALSSIVEMPKGPALTVHPLGGCAMADSKASGVVDEYGRVFDGATEGVHEGLVVLDGSIIPTSLGINPAFTIAAVALRAAEFHATNWLQGPVESDKDAKLDALPRARKVEPVARTATEIKIIERVVGEVSLQGQAEPLMVELTIAFEKVRLRNLARFMRRHVPVGQDSRIRIYTKGDWQKHWDLGTADRQFEAAAFFTAPLSGHMRLLDRGSSTSCQRAWRAGKAWVLNRGLRDLYQRWFTRRRSNKAKKPRDNFFKRLITFYHFASHAGEERQFVYELNIGELLQVAQIGPPDEQDPSTQEKNQKTREHLARVLPGGFIKTVKRLTYSRRCNPWRQLSEMSVEAFPGLAPAERAPVLTLEPKFFARQQKHLLQFVKHRDQTTGLLDMASFLLYILRILLSIHIWSFRLPDARDSERKINRLPVDIPGLPAREKTCLTVGTMADGNPIKIVLTRYPRRDSTKRPVVCIHGFSANGTSFAHPALETSLAKYLWDRGRDVWVLDLRTSSGLPDTSRLPWKFEEVASTDIPRAFEHIQKKVAEERKTGVADIRIDAVAHCMGAAMLSMAILDDGTAVPGSWDDAQREAFLASIGRVVLSQVGPMVVFTAANIFRGYAVGYVQQIAGNQTFEFTPPRDLTSQLLDRLLATAPYPDEEFDYENPTRPCVRTPWVGTRHRMDAWFGRTFNVKNVAPEVLECIDDMFGAINLHTTFQTIHFARNGSICTRDGRNIYVTPRRLERWKNIPTLSIHGEDNGLADPATMKRMDELMKDAACEHYESEIIRGFGHQDCLIGMNAPIDVFPKVAEFLDRDVPVQRPTAKLDSNADESNLIATAPWLGPVVGKIDARGRLEVAVAANPKLREVKSLLVAPVVERDGTWSPPFLSGLAQAYPLVPAPQSKDSDRLRWYRTLIDVNWPSGTTVLILLSVHQFPSMPTDPWANLDGFEKSAFNPAPLSPFKLDDHLASTDGTTGKPLEKATAWPLLETGIGMWGKQGVKEIERQQTIARMAAHFLRSCSERDLCAALFERPVSPSADDPLVFIHASCQYPAGPLDEELAAASYRRINEYMKRCSPGEYPQFLVLNGDQVYVDPTAGLMDPSIKDDRYGLPYETFFRMREAREVLKKVPAYMIPDDHEFQDNWEPLQIAAFRENLPCGKEAYFKHQRLFVPPIESSDNPPLWFLRQVRGHEFFFADTRTERDVRAADGSGSIMKERQSTELLAWLSSHKSSGKLMFVVSPSILLPRRVASANSNVSALRSDAWDGFPQSLHRLLSHIVNECIENVIFLSGDEHHSCIATITLTSLPAQASAIEEVEEDRGSVIVRSIHSSGLYTPFVLANGDHHELAGSETFHFPDPQHADRVIRCQVETRFMGPSMGGFTVIDCRQQDDAWCVRCTFKLHEGERATEEFAIGARCLSFV